MAEDNNSSSEKKKILKAIIDRETRRKEYLGSKELDVKTLKAKLKIFEKDLIGAFESKKSTPPGYKETYKETRERERKERGGTHAGTSVFGADLDFQLSKDFDINDEKVRLGFDKLVNGIQKDFLIKCCPQNYIFRILDCVLPKDCAEFLRAVGILETVNFIRENAILFAPFIDVVSLVEEVDEYLVKNNFKSVKFGQSAYLKSGHYDGKFLPNDATISFWVKLDSISSNRKHLIGEYTDGGKNFAITLINGKIQFRIYKDDTSKKFTSSVNLFKGNHGDPVTFDNTR